jgi:hypothetical protein
MSTVTLCCENLAVFFHIVMAKRKSSINDSIKSEYSFIRGVNENVECTLCNAKFAMYMMVGWTLPVT